MPTLTERFVARQKPKTRPYEISCATLRGFMLRVLPTGKKVFFARVRDGAKYRRVRLGLAGSISFVDAREQAMGLLLGSERVAPPRSRLRRATDGPIVPTVREFAKRYDAGHIEVHLKQGTKRVYRQDMAHIVAAFGSLRLDQITLEDVERFHASKAATPYAANHAVRTFSNVYTKAIDWRVLPRDFLPPTRGVKLYKEKRRERFLSPAERRRVEEVLEIGLITPPGNHGRLHWSIVAVVRLLSLTGMRRSEVLGLTWDMVDRRHRCLRLPDSKTGQKIVPISAEVVALLDNLEAQHRRPEIPFVAYSRMRTAVSKRGIGDAWQRIRRAAGLGDNMRLHDLRHSAASDALMAGVPLAVVGKILGHRNPATTARYAHLSDSVVRAGVDSMGKAIAAGVSDGKRSQRRQ